MLSQYIKIERDYNGVIVDCTSRIPLDISKVKIKKKKPNCHLVANINDDWSLCRFLLGDYPFKTCTNTKHNNSQYCETHYNICYDVKRSNRVII
jgi:hypothetical protein